MEEKSNDSNRPSNLIGNDSKISDNTSLIQSDKKLPRAMLSNEDKKKIERTVNQALKIGKEEIMNFKEVSIKKSLFFRIFISGTIEYGKFSSDDPIKAKYDFVAGEGWEKEDGAINGETQYSCKGEGLYNHHSYSQHFEISYRSINPFGWPQLVLNCFSVDNNGNETVKGYGCVHVPTSTGRHERRVNIFHATENFNIWSKFFGNNLCGCGNQQNNEISNTPKVISSGQGREISRATCEGWINVVFQVAFRDIEKFGLISK